MNKEIEFKVVISEEGCVITHESDYQVDVDTIKLYQAIINVANDWRLKGEKK